MFYRDVFILHSINTSCAPSACQTLLQTLEIKWLTRQIRFLLSRNCHSSGGRQTVNNPSWWFQTEMSAVKEQGRRWRASEVNEGVVFKPGCLSAQACLVGLLWPPGHLLTLLVWRSGVGCGGSEVRPTLSPVYGSISFVSAAENISKCPHPSTETLRVRATSGSPRIYLDSVPRHIESDNFTVPSSSPD